MFKSIVNMKEKTNQCIKNDTSFNYCKDMDPIQTEVGVSYKTIE